jgi:hypothetical protein
LRSFVIEGEPKLLEEGVEFILEFDSTRKSVIAHEARSDPATVRGVVAVFRNRGQAQAVIVHPPQDGDALAPDPAVDGGQKGV